MNVKKEVIEKMTECLSLEIKKCNDKISSNKYKMKNLIREQTILKREKVKITEVLRLIKK